MILAERWVAFLVAASSGQQSAEDKPPAAGAPSELAFASSGNSGGAFFTAGEPGAELPWAGILLKGGGLAGTGLAEAPCAIGVRGCCDQQNNETPRSSSA